MTDLRELEKNATPGPWEVRVGLLVSNGWDVWFENKSDAALIAATRNALPYLLDVEYRARVVYDALIEYGVVLPGAPALRDALEALDSHLKAER